MFKKTLVALSLLGIASQGGASTITVTKEEVSEQAILTSTNVSSTSFVVTTEVDIASGSTLQLAYSAAPANAASVTLEADDGTCGAGASITYAGLTNDNKTANYTVSVTATPITSGCVLTFGDDVGGTTTPAAFAKADVQAADITVASSFTVVGSGVDPSAAAKAILGMSGEDQFSLTVSDDLDATVDVEAGRKAYTNSQLFDDLDITFNDDGTGATATSATYTITGDFAWADDPLTDGFQLLDRNGQEPIAIQTGVGVTFGDGTAVAAPTATTLTLVDSNPIDGETITLRFTPLTDANIGGGDATDDVVAVALPNDGFKVEAEVAYEDLVASPNTGTGTQDIAAATENNGGSWGLNGASVKIYAVPFGAEVESHSIFVSNSGSSTGAVTASVVWNNNDAVEVNLGDIGAKGNTYLNLISALEGIGEKPAWGRADVTFTVNAPAADITFTAAYNTAEGRANLYMEEQANLAGISNAAKTSSACAYDALGEGIDAADAGVAPVAGERKYTIATGC